MTDHAQPADIRELSRTVANLTEALARTEQRSAQLVRIVRWGVLGVLSLLAFAGFLIVDRTGIAYARKGGRIPAGLHRR